MEKERLFKIFPSDKNCNAHFNKSRTEVTYYTFE